MFNILRRWRRRHAADRLVVDEAQWSAVESALPFLEALSGDERTALRHMALEFIADKEFHGAQGLVLDDGILLSIALQACLPVLHLGLDAYSDWVGIVVYPGDFIIPRSQMDEAGVVHEFDDTVLGEAWEGGPVLLSWFGGEDAGEAPQDTNVVIHEFAHKLDMANGAADGMPSLHAGMSRADWAAAFEEAYADMCERVDRGDQTQIDPYGAEHPSEFFAVASEAFFESPDTLRAAYPAVYRQLSLFYRQDPAARAAARRAVA
ncbi:MAG: zinc-dependent peptidase [Zoogloea sp.]|nr:zinc-dependent peptidase [Zoogloea sp.]